MDGFSIPVALKVFSPEQFSDEAEYETGMSRLAHVASQVARIQHDHLVDVQNVVRLDGVFVMEMEWVDVRRSPAAKPRLCSRKSCTQTKASKSTTSVRR